MGIIAEKCRHLFSVSRIDTEWSYRCAQGLPDWAGLLKGTSMWNRLWTGCAVALVVRQVPFVPRDAGGAPEPTRAQQPVPDWQRPAYLRRQRAQGDSLALARWQ